MFSRDLIKRELKNKGWSQRRAAEALGRCYQHVNFVLNGVRESRSLLEKLAALPPSPIPYANQGFAASGQPKSQKDQNQ